MKFVDIGRNTPYGNPCRIARNTSKFYQCPECGDFHFTAGSTLLCYEQYLRRRISDDPNFVKLLSVLKEKIQEGYILRCPGCDISSPTCHGRILEKYL